MAGWKSAPQQTELWLVDSIPPASGRIQLFCGPSPARRDHKSVLPLLHFAEFMPPTLILLPGLHGTADLFEAFLKVVPAEFPRQAISYPTEQYLPYDQLLTRLEEELKAERSLVLIAESFSGPLAVRFAAAHPRRVRAVVLCASFVRLPLPPWYERLLAPILFRLPISLAALRRYLMGSEAAREVLLTVRQSLRQSRPKVLLAPARIIPRRLLRHAGPLPDAGALSHRKRRSPDSPPGA